MKKYFILLATICSTSAALAANYNLVNDWVFDGPNNPNGPWGYGMMLENAPGVFQPFVTNTKHDTTSSPGWDRWVDPTSASDTCVVWFVPGGLWTFGPNTVILNAWDTHASAVHFGNAPGTYNLNVGFQVGGYVTPTATYPDSRVYVLLNDTTVLFSQELLGFNGTGTSLQVTLGPNDFLDFVAAGNPEVRVGLGVDLQMVPEPSCLALLGLGGLLFLRRNR